MAEQMALVDREGIQHLLKRPFQRMDYLHSATPGGWDLKGLVVTTNKPNSGLRCYL